MLSSLHSLTPLTHKTLTLEARSFFPLGGRGGSAAVVGAGNCAASSSSLSSSNKSPYLALERATAAA